MAWTKGQASFLITLWYRREVSLLPFAKGNLGEEERGTCLGRCLQGPGRFWDLDTLWGPSVGAGSASGVEGQIVVSGLQSLYLSWASCWEYEGAWAGGI